ncbi:MAG: phosphoribosylglycinamide formyltransferase [Myxococcota bacterium]|nr:phosphoribosylglycinamide formyltransferase [Myxococcota bacterium]
MSRAPVGVLISGRGSNLQALLDAASDPAYPARIVVVASNRPQAAGLARARSAGVPAVVVPSRGRSRLDFEDDLVARLHAHGVEWVALAGFMRLLTPRFLDAFPGRVLNIHPSLLPAFPGLRAQAQALRAGVRIAGATVHRVTAGTDEGPILAQGAVPVMHDDTEDALAARILGVEHRIYPAALAAAVRAGDGAVVGEDLCLLGSGEKAASPEA